MQAAAGTTAIPERTVHRGRDETFDDQAFDAEGYDRYQDRRYDDDLDDRLAQRGRPGERLDREEMHAAGADSTVRGPGTGPVGGRAALRAQRQAAEAARRKAGKGRRDTAMPRDRAAMTDGEVGAPRRPRRVALSLLAMALVALAVLGVYSFATPDTRPTGAQAASTPSSPSTGAPTSAPATTALAPEPTPVQPAQVAPTTPVRVPVTVLNSTSINGLAAKISAQVVAGGWESPGVGAYTGGDVAVSTVFFTEGDEQQRQAAVQLVDQFPQLHGPAPRFFEVPEVAAPGLVVVATGDWQP
jgi:LytR cell envelope-related transcriptional attenuator